MDLWDAIKEMRRLSAEGIPFGFTFMSYDATARASKGVIEVRHARLLKREKQENHFAYIAYERAEEAVHLNEEWLYPTSFYQLYRDDNPCN